MITWLTTLRPDGSPHTTPVWFWFDADTFWIASAAHNVKVRNVLRNPRVSVALIVGEHPVVAEGRATVLDHFPKAAVTGFAEKYNGWQVTDPEPDGRRVLIRIPVVRWLAAGR